MSDTKIPSQKVRDLMQEACMTMLFKYSDNFISEDTREANEVVDELLEKYFKQNPVT